MTHRSHSFSTSLAKQIGLKEAIILQHIQFLQEATAKEKQDWRENWVRRSAKSMSSTYEYLSAKEIKGATDRLFKGGLLNVKQDNEFVIDRTKSFLITKKGLDLLGEVSDLTKGKMDDTKGQMRNDQKANAVIDITLYYPLVINNDNANEVEKLFEDEGVRETFSMVYKVPAEKFEPYLKAWILKSKTDKETYASRAKILHHFWSFSSIRFEKEKKSIQQPQYARPASNKMRTVEVENTGYTADQLF